MKYIALLRGINVGGKNKVDMKVLKNCFERIGFQKVKTYINSGNVIFDSEEKDKVRLIRICEEIIEKEFGFHCTLAIITAEDLQESLENAPVWWGEDKESKHNAIFVIKPATTEEIIKAAGEIKPDYERLYFYKDVIFWSAPNDTFSMTRWSKVVGTKAYKDITIRNFNTTKKLLELADR